jgi:hypothetical protein
MHQCITHDSLKLTRSSFADVDRWSTTIAIDLSAAALGSGGDPLSRPSLPLTSSPIEPP